MFLRAKTRKKDGKLHHYFNMERVIDEHVLYDCHDLLLEHKRAV